MLVVMVTTVEKMRTRIVIESDGVVLRVALVTMVISSSCNSSSE